MAGIDDQIACVKREIKMRQRVYPRWVENGRMHRDAAEKEIETMRAVLATLEAEKGRQQRSDAPDLFGGDACSDS